MSYQDAKELVLSKDIQTELERKLVFAEFCNRAYEGEVKNRGDAVKIVEVQRPKITTTTDGKGQAFGTPEAATTASQIMIINQVSTFNLALDSVDGIETMPQVWEKVRTEAAHALANVQDQHIASMAADKNLKRYATSATLVSADNILPMIDKALQTLMENDVPSNEQVVLECTPRFYMILKSKVIDLDTDNSQKIENGKVARYGNCLIKVSNNVATENSGATDLCMVRTKNAIAYVNPLLQIQEYPYHDSFMGSVLRATSLYQAKVTRPKEAFVLNVKYA